MVEKRCTYMRMRLWLEVISSCEGTESSQGHWSDAWERRRCAFRIPRSLRRVRYGWLWQLTGCTMHTIGAGSSDYVSAYKWGAPLIWKETYPKSLSAEAVDSKCDNWLKVNCKKFENWHAKAGLYKDYVIYNNGWISIVSNRLITRHSSMIPVCLSFINYFIS